MFFRQKRHADDSSHWARANFLCLKLDAFLWALVVSVVLSCFVNLCLKALVFLYLKSRGVYFLFLNCDLAFSILFSLMTVRHLATAFLTSYD
jgi:hypothetical protein